MANSRAGQKSQNTLGLERLLSREEETHKDLQLWFQRKPMPSYGLLGHGSQCANTHTQLHSHTHH